MNNEKLIEINDLIAIWQTENPEWVKNRSMVATFKLFTRLTKSGEENAKTASTRKSALVTLKSMFTRAQLMVDNMAEGDELTKEEHKDLIEGGYLTPSGKKWGSPFSRRQSHKVDRSTETVISEIVKARTDMAELIDGYLISGNYQEHTLEKVEEVIAAWAKTLVLETRPLSSINPKNKVLSFANTYEILSQNAPISKLREYRRAFDEKFDSKNKDGVLIARHKVKWCGTLVDEPIINYTPQPRAKKGESKKE